MPQCIKYPVLCLVLKRCQMETCSLEKLKSLQLARFKTTLKRVYDNVEIYRNKMRDAGIKPEDIQNHGDIRHLPFTTKQDLRDTYPYGMLCVPKSDIVRYHTSSGTTGQRTAVGFSKRDIDVMADTVARSLHTAGCTKDSVIHNAYAYGLFTGGLAAHYGGEKLGATVLPVSTGNTSGQVQLLKDFQADTLLCTPAYSLYLADEIKKLGLTLSDFNLRRGIFGAEWWTEEMRAEIEKRFGIEAYNIYGLSELGGPGVSVECECRNGSHIWEDRVLPEIIDPKTTEVLSDEQQGELVMSNFSEGMPVIRYRTRDITSLNHDPCDCKRTHLRMNRIVGRSDDMLIIGGANVYPSQIETVLLSSMFADYIEPHYQIIAERKDNRDSLEVQVEIKRELVGDTMSHALQDTIKQIMTSATGINTKITLLPPGSLERSEGKVKRVIDDRQKS